MDNLNDQFFPNASLSGPESDEQDKFATLNDRLFDAVTQESPAALESQLPPTDAVAADLPTAPAPQPESLQPIPDMTMTPSPIGGEAYDVPVGTFVDETNPIPANQNLYDANRRLFEGDPVAFEKAKQVAMRSIIDQPGPTIAKTQLNENPSVSNIKGTPGNYTMNVMGSDVPVDNETAIKAMSKANDFKLPNWAPIRGFARLNQAIALLGVRLGLQRPEEALRVVAEINRINPDAPEWIQKGLQEIISQDTFLGSLKASARNPVAVLSVVGESLPMSAPSLALFLGGSVFGSPAGGAVAGGTMTYAVQYSDTILDEMRQNGIDTNNDKAMLEAFRDEAFMEKARERANARGIPIAFFDAMSMGLSGKLLSLALKNGVTTGRALAGGAAELTQQSTFGGLGEYVAQDLEVRLGFRDKINWGEVNLEAIAEGPIGAVETAIGTVNARQQAKIADAENRAETAMATQIATDLLDPNLNDQFFSAVSDEAPAEQTATVTENANDQLFSAIDSTQQQLVPSGEAQNVTVNMAEPPAQPEVAEAVQPETTVQPIVQPEPAAQTQPAPQPEAPAASPITPLDQLKTLIERNGVQYEPPQPRPDLVSDERFNDLMQKALKAGRFNNTFIIANGDRFGSGEEVTEAMRRATELGVIVDNDGFIQNVDEIAAKLAQPVEAPAAEQVNPQQTPNPIGNAIPADVDFITDVQTPDSQGYYSVEPVVVELADLKQAQGVLQPRDRSLKESDILALNRANPNQFNPARLLDSPTTGDGAPIIARDGTIMSGNGRVLTLQELYARHPDSVVRYNKALEEAGIDISGFKQPVLVRRLSDQNMTIQDLQKFADLANTEDKAKMSTTEAAQRDARRMPQEIVNLYTGGDFTSAENKPFVDAFSRTVLSPTEQGQFTRDGKLTKDGVDRMRAAILATAYNDTDVLALMLDSTDDNIKAISNAMMANAPKLSQLKADIQSGEIRPEFDISQQIAESAKLISSLRDRGIKPRDFFAQQDAFSDTDPIVEALIRAFYNDELTRAKSQKIMKDVLDFYVEEAGNRKVEQLFEDNVTPVDTIRSAREKAERKADGTEGQGSLLTERSVSDRAATRSEQTQRTISERSGQNARPIRTARTDQNGQIADAAVTAPRVTEAADPVGSTDDAIVSLDALDEIDNQRTEKPGTLLSKEAERNKTALMFTAFADAGLDPNRAVNLPIRQQIKILSKQMTDRFGLNIEVSDKANAKDARDQLLTGYHQLSIMAHAFGLPYKAIGLEGSLTFAIAKNIGAYGVYNPNNRTITIPRRVNSFGHEWFHALDHYIFEKYGNISVGGFPLQTDATRSGGTEAFADDAPVGVRDSYIALMKALFKDKATEAAQLAALEQQISEFEARNITKDYRNMATWKRLDAQRQRILEGTGKSKKVKKTQFRRDAEFFAGISMSDPNYWASPREMFARAGESFISRQMMLQSANADFLAKSQDAYNMVLEDLGVKPEDLYPPTPANIAKIMDSRLALTFPKGEEMMEIFGAYKNLIDAIAAETILGEGTIGDNPGKEFVIDVRDLHEETAEEAQGIIAAQRQAIRNRKIFNARMEGRAKEYGKYGGMRIVGSGARKSFQDSFTAPLFYQKKSIIKMLIGRYPKSKGLKLLFNRLATDTGGDLQSTYEGGNLLDAQMRQTRIFADRLKNIIKKHKIDEFDATEMTQLRMLLTSQDDLGSSPAKVEAAAGDLRLMYDSLYEYLRNSGLDIGYAESGYMQRLLDHVEIAADRKGFIKAANGVYRIVFENEIGKEFDGSLEQVEQIRAFVQQKRDGIARTDEYQDFIKSSVYRKIQNYRRDIARAQEENDDTALAKAEANLEALVESQEAQELFEQFYDDIKRVYADIASRNWQEAIAEGQIGDPSISGAPQSDFRKRRTLPPEADALMEKYYISDPLENLTTYIMGAVRKAEYNRRFGKHLIPQGENKNKKYADFLDYQLKKIASKDNLLESELNLLEEAIDTMLGRNVTGYTANSVQKLANRLSALLSITLLIRAPIASIAEPFTVAMTSGEVSKGARSFIQTLQELPGIRNMTKNTAENIRQRAQFARILGVIDDPEVGDIIANRIGGEFAGDRNLNKMMSSFFNKIKLAGITNAQRRSAARIGFQYLSEVAYDYRNPINERMKLKSAAILKDFGVGKANLEQFVDYLLSFNNMQRAKEMKDYIMFREARGAKAEGGLNLPSIDEIMKDDGTFSDMGLQLSVAIGRFADQSIQDPRSSDRPLYAETPVGRFVYGIMSFIYSFQDKVLFAMKRRAQREAKIANKVGESEKSAYAAELLLTAAPALSTLVMAHTLISSLREFLLNSERWDREWEEADEDPAKFFLNYLGPLALSRSGLTGAFDPIYQAFTGLRYQRDLANATLGTGAYVAQSIEDMASVFINNSPNTLYSEYRFLRGLWNLTVNPIVSGTIAAAPLSPLTAFGATGLAQYGTAPSTRDKAINLLLESVYGESYVRGGKGKTKKTTRPY